MVGGGRPVLPEIFGQPAPVGSKSPILTDTSRSGVMRWNGSTYV